PEPGSAGSGGEKGQAGGGLSPGRAADRSPFLRRTAGNPRDQRARHGPRAGIATPAGLSVHDDRGDERQMLRESRVGIRLSRKRRAGRARYLFDEQRRDRIGGARLEQIIFSPQRGAWGGGHRAGRK